MYRALMVRAIEVMQVRYKPYATKERTDYSNALVWTIFGMKCKLLNVNIIMAHENYAKCDF